MRQGDVLAVVARLDTGWVGITTAAGEEGYVWKDWVAPYTPGGSSSAAGAPSGCGDQPGGGGGAGEAYSTGAAPEYPVSGDGTCPYCRSARVQYLLLSAAEMPDQDLSPLLRGLLGAGHAARLPPADAAAPEPPSFKCVACGYGFNLDWTRASLETIFGDGGGGGGGDAWDRPTQPVPTPGAARALLRHAAPPAGAPGLVPTPELESAASTAGAGGGGVDDWQRDVTQWRAHQAMWGNESYVASTEHSEEDATQAAMDAVRLVIEAAKAGRTVDHTTLVPAGMGAPGAHAQQQGGGGGGYVTQYEEYSAAANFNQTSGRFAEHTQDEHWASKGLSSSSDLRGLSQFMDPSQLEEHSEPQDVGWDGRIIASAGGGGGKRHRVSAKQVRAFKDAKKKRKLAKSRDF